MKRHHYAVTRSAGGSLEQRWFHTFAEASADFDRRVGEARQGGMEERASSYWREDLAGAAGSCEVALDDAGLVGCGPLCEAAAG